MKEQVEQTVQNFASPILEQLGYELVEVKYKKEENGMNLTLFIHKQGGITLADCELVAKTLNEPLDELNPTKDEQYNFNVSSVGLDRPIKTEKDFLRNIGKEVEISFQTPTEVKTVKGVLKNINNNIVTLNQKGKLTEIDFNKIIKTMLVIKF